MNKSKSKQENNAQATKRNRFSKAQPTGIVTAKNKWATPPHASRREGAWKTAFKVWTLFADLNFI